MVTNIDSLNAELNKVEHLINQRKLTRAATLIGRLRNHHGNQVEDRNRYWFLLALAKDLQGHYQEAARYRLRARSCDDFTAIMLADNKRDSFLMLVRQRRVDEAIAHADELLWKPLRQPEVKNDNDRRGVSQMAYARALLVRSVRDSSAADLKLALKGFAQADELICSNKQWKFNNSYHWMRAAALDGNRQQAIDQVKLLAHGDPSRGRRVTGNVFWSASIYSTTLAKWLSRRLIIRQP